MVKLVRKKKKRNKIKVCAHGKKNRTRKATALKINAFQIIYKKEKKNLNNAGKKNPWQRAMSVFLDLWIRQKTQSARRTHNAGTRAHMHAAEGGGGVGGLANAKHRIQAGEKKKRTESMLDELAGPLANPSAAAFFTPFLSNSLSLSIARSLSAFFP